MDSIFLKVDATFGLLASNTFGFSANRSCGFARKVSPFSVREYDLDALVKYGPRLKLKEMFIQPKCTS